MTRVGWLADKGEVVGGAELTQAEFRAAAPAGVEIVDCPPGGSRPGLRRLRRPELRPVRRCDTRSHARPRVVKFWHDVGPHLQPGVREALAGATHICCSPLQADAMGLERRSH